MHSSLGHVALPSNARQIDCPFHPHSVRNTRLHWSAENHGKAWIPVGIMGQSHHLTRRQGCAKARQMPPSPIPLYHLSTPVKDWPHSNRLAVQEDCATNTRWNVWGPPPQLRVNATNEQSTRLCSLGNWHQQMASAKNWPRPPWNSMPKPFLAMAGNPGNRAVCDARPIYACGAPVAQS